MPFVIFVTSFIVFSDSPLLEFAAATQALGEDLRTNCAALQDLLHLLRYSQHILAHLAALLIEGAIARPAEYLPLSKISDNTVHRWSQVKRPARSP